MEAKLTALFNHLGTGRDSLTAEELEAMVEAAQTGLAVAVEGEEYLVLTDSEADAAFHENIESYIDDCVLSEIPEAYRSYFDAEKFERDVQLGDGRGPTLALYDGEEHEEKVDGIWYYIYRVG